MKTNITSIVVFSLSLCFASLNFAHDGHVHKAPLIACKSLSKGELCSYIVSKDKVFKGTCQLFDTELMCVRNQPIEDLSPLENKQLGEYKDKSSWR